MKLLAETKFREIRAKLYVPVIAHRHHRHHTLPYGPHALREAVYTVRKGRGRPYVEFGRSF